MQWLLDTCVVSELTRKVPDAQVVQWLTDNAELATLSAVLIASCATVRNLTVVTRNTKHFEDSGVKTLNPWLAA